MATPVTTNRQIAQEAGLSEATVSLVLNNRAAAVGIKPATQRRVREIARKYNYIPNPLARGLNGKNTHSIGIVWSLGQPVAGVFLRELAIRLFGRQYVTFMTDGRSDPEICLKVLREYDRRGVDGVVFRADDLLLTDARVMELLKRFKAAVVSTPQAIEASTLDQLVRDDGHGVSQVMDYWHQTGRRKTCFIGAAVGSPDLIQSMRTHKSRVGRLDEDWILDIGPGARVGQNFELYQATLQRYFADGRFPFDSILCAGDDGAVAASAWLRQQGYRLPEDVAVVGFGNSDLIRGFDPPLASVERHEQEMVGVIEEMLFARLEKPDVAGRIRNMPATFVWRESAGEKLSV